MKGYYKQKYGIGIYKKIRNVGETDELIGLFDSAEEFANFIGKSLRKAYDILFLHLSKGQKDIIVNGKMCELHFIDMRD